MTSKSPEFRIQHILLGRDSLAIVLSYAGTWSNKELDASSVFKDFVEQNSVCFWNQCLVQSVKNLAFRGWIFPMTVLVEGSNFALEVVRSAWARRVLRPPKGYIICKLGDISILELHPVLQTQFAPLSEVLCKVVVELNSENIPATAATVSTKLKEFFPKIEEPSEEILYKTLGSLIRERKLYHTGEGYFVVSPGTYRERALSPLCERQMLMTNEEAIVRLHGEQRERSLAVQVDESDIAASCQCTSSSPSSTLKKNYAFSSQHSSLINNPASPPADHRVVERSHSLKVLRIKAKANDNREIFGRYGSFKDHADKKEKLTNANENDSSEKQKCEKQSMLSRLFRCVQSLTEKPNKHGTFSAQFPSLEWFGSEQLHCHSVATQTQLQFQKFQSKPNNKKLICGEPEFVKISWPQTEYKDSSKSQNLCKVLNKELPIESESHFIHKKTNFCPRPSVSKYSPSQRHSYATFNHHTKRHHYKHRRSSSDSPKSDKIKKNEVGALYERKIDSVKKTLGSRSSNPKAIISPCSIVYKQMNPSNLSSDFNTVKTAPSPSINISISSPISTNKAMSTSIADSSNDVTINFPKSVSLVNQANGINLTPKKHTKIPEKATIFQDSHSPSNSVSSSELKLSVSESNSELPIFSEDKKLPKSTKSSEPVTFKVKEDSLEIINDSISLKKPPSTKEILIDNSINVEFVVEKKNSNVKANNVSTTVSQTVTDETTIKKGNGKVVTVTNVTTNLTHGSAMDNEKHCQEIKIADLDKSIEEEDIFNVNGINVEFKNNPCVIDCSSSCNIITELK